MRQYLIMKLLAYFLVIALISFLNNFKLKQSVSTWSNNYINSVPLTKLILEKQLNPYISVRVVDS